MHRGALWLLKLCVSGTLLSRGWLTWKWDSPIRGLLWKEDWWSGFIENYTEWTWNDFARHSDSWISGLLTGIGILLMFLSLVPWLLQFRYLEGLLWPATFLLLVDGFALWSEHNYELGSALEHSLQIISPLALFFASSRQLSETIWNRSILIASAMTFFGHGLYAMGWHTVPLLYQTMTMKLLRVSQEGALVFLKTVGWLDFVAAICLVSKATRKWALLYMVLWGGATALARIFSHLGSNQPGFGFDPWLAETLVRSSHWALPFFLLGRVIGDKAPPQIR